MSISENNRKIIEEKLVFIYGEERSKKIIIEIERLLEKYRKKYLFSIQEKKFPE